jgi:hypothetical protein
LLTLRKTVCLLVHVLWNADRYLNIHCICP